MAHIPDLPPKRFTLVHEPHNVVIRDGDLNLFFLAESGFGPKSSNIALAELVVAFLNEAFPPAV